MTKRKMSSMTTKKMRTSIVKPRVKKARKKTRRMPLQLQVSQNFLYTNQVPSTATIIELCPIWPTRAHCSVSGHLPVCIVEDVLTFSEEQAPPKKKLKTAPSAKQEAPHKNGTASNGHDEDEEGEGEEDEEFDEEEEEGEGEDEEEEEEGDEEEEVPTKGAGKVVSAPSAGEGESNAAVAAGGDDEED
jgi:hypothetical protein